MQSFVGLRLVVSACAAHAGDAKGKCGEAFGVAPRAQLERHATEPVIRSPALAKTPDNVCTPSQSSGHTLHCYPTFGRSGLEFSA